MFVRRSVVLAQRKGNLEYSWLAFGVCGYTSAECDKQGWETCRSRSKVNPGGCFNRGFSLLAWILSGSVDLRAKSGSSRVNGSCHLTAFGPRAGLIALGH